MKLFDLAGDEDDRKTSPYCWRIRLALAHKKLDFYSVPWRAEEKDMIAFSGQGRVPVLVDGDTTIVDSWRIAEHLEASYPNAPSFFGSKEAHEMDKAFFRNKWEYIHGMSVEKFGGSSKVKNLQDALEPMRRILKEQPFLGGRTPNFADLAVAGHFAWARAVSPIQLLEQHDPIFEWRAQMFDRFRKVVEPTVGFQQSMQAANST